jgi:hypothetical protein
VSVKVSCMRRSFKSSCISLFRYGDKHAQATLFFLSKSHCSAKAVGFGEEFRNHGSSSDALSVGGDGGCRGGAPFTRSFRFPCNAW